LELIARNWAYCKFDTHWKTCRMDLRSRESHHPEPLSSIQSPGKENTQSRTMEHPSVNPAQNRGNRVSYKPAFSDQQALIPRFLGSPS